MPKEVKFNCSGCGACCRRISTAVANTSHIKELEFPYGWDENGKCEMLLDDNSCMVYAHRPLLCDVERLALHLGYDKEPFFKANNKACIELQDADNVDPKYRLKL